MATPTNVKSNAPKALALAQPNLRSRPFRAATKLIAKSAANMIDIPGIKDSVRAAGGIVRALKPDLLQEPARNDLIAQNLIDYLDEILLCVNKDGTEEERSEYVEDLERIKTTAIELKNKKYGTKLACQRDIGRELAKRKDEIMERALLFSVEGSEYGRRANGRSTELEQRYERVSESLAALKNQLDAAQMQLAQQARLVDQLQSHRCAVVSNLIDLNFKVFF